MILGTVPPGGRVHRPHLEGCQACRAAGAEPDQVRGAAEKRDELAPTHVVPEAKAEVSTDLD